MKEETREISDYQIYFLVPIKWEFISMAIGQNRTSDPSYESPREIKEFLITYNNSNEMVDSLVDIHSTVLTISEKSKFSNQICEEGSFLFRWSLKANSQMEKKLACFALDLIADFTSPKLFALLCSRLK